MLPIISGTVRSSVKLAELNNKWMQKKESGNIFQKEMTPEQRQISQFQEDLKKMRENNDMNEITSKLQSGQKLTPEEVEYLQRNNPQLYQEYKAALAEKEAYERELRNCKTQEEADELKINKMNGYLSQAKSISNNPNIPKSKKLELLEKIMMHVSGIQQAHMEFVESGEYASLPTREALAKENTEDAQRSEELAKELGAEEPMQEEAEEAQQSEELAKELGVEKPMQEEAEDAQRSEEIAKEFGAEEPMQEETENSALTEQASGRKDKLALTEHAQGEKPKQILGTEEKTDIFAEVRKELVTYIRNNRPSGYGLELLADELKENK